MNNLDRLKEERDFLAKQLQLLEERKREIERLLGHFLGQYQQGGGRA